MELPKHSVTLSPEQISDLARRLAQMRHNVNNHLSLMSAVVEVIERRPEMAERMMANLLQQPAHVVEEIQKFTQAFEQAMSIHRGGGQ